MNFLEEYEHGISVILSVIIGLLMLYSAVLGASALICTGAPNTALPPKEN